MTKLETLAKPSPRKRGPRRLRRASWLYCLLVVVPAFAAFFWSVTHDSVVACAPQGYGSDWYLAYCDVGQYGDYEHGAMFLGLEESAVASLSEAQVVFLGNSRIQFAASAPSLRRWFAERHLRFYALGFGYGENSAFARALLRRVGLHPRAVVINIDAFFSARVTPPAHSVSRDQGARAGYAHKRLLQRLHRRLCTALPFVCGDAFAIYRSRSLGVWKALGRDGGRPAPVSDAPSDDVTAIGERIAIGREFLAALPVPHDCVLLTVVPTVATEIAQSRRIASALGYRLIEPHVAGLMTSDGSHLDADSADRWASAFLAQVGSGISACAAPGGGDGRDAASR